MADGNSTHRLLRRQLGKHLGRDAEVPAELQSFIAAVGAAYCDHDKDRAMLERSLELSSRELSEAHEQVTRARERLIDAIEATSDGFAFYDSDDRLELCNSRYRELLYPGGGAAVEPGMRFEDILRGAVAQNLIKDAASDPENWICQRLARHRECGEPQLQRRSDGSWIQVAEHRISGGGTVAVYSDLTELKESEQRAASANRLILDSIRYASRIQSAILPTREAFASAAGDHFLIWQPRDVVGGDFFWFHRAQGGFLAFVGDCTGHGVPGAFMTLIACGLIDRILQTIPADEPSRLLADLHRGLQSLLGQDAGQGETDDGLEAGVCFVSESEPRLIFSGARMSLWHANCGSIREIKGEKAGIGYRRVSREIRFSSVPVDFDDRASFYLTTDGLIDQVGGTRRRSFGKRRFSQFIAEQAGRPMAEQGASLIRKVMDYQGAEPRRDDVTVLGFSRMGAT